jgi:hypothetical protein
MHATTRGADAVIGLLDVAHAFSVLARTLVRALGFGSFEYQALA